MAGGIRSAYGPGREAFAFRSERGAFTTSDGVRLGYEVGGRSDGPVLLFCYGLLCSGFHFKYQWEHFAESHKLVMLDYRGHHVSASPESITTLNFPRLAADLSECLDQLGARRPVTVVGHSMGVNVALEFYERFPAQVARLVLIAGAATFPAKKRVAFNRVAFAGALLKIADGLFPSIADWFWRKQARAPGADHIAGLVGFNTKLSKPEDIKRVVELMGGFQPRVFAQLLGEYVRHNRLDTLNRVFVPSLIVSGGLDRAVPAHFQEILHERIRGSQLVTIKDGSHCPQFDRPDEVNEAMAEFFSKTTEKGDV